MWKRRLATSPADRTLVDPPDSLPVIAIRVFCAGDKTGKLSLFQS